jgi:hypothetical protein
LVVFDPKEFNMNAIVKTAITSGALIASVASMALRALPTSISPACATSALYAPDRCRPECSFRRISMKLPGIRPLAASSLLLVLAACADQGAVGATPAVGSAPLAVDLGASSRIPRIAGLAGEGEGYGTLQPTPTAHAAMPAMPHDSAAPMAKQPSMPAMDHSGMDHSSMPGMNHSPAAGVQ